MEQHDRLQYARKNAGYKNYREAAKRFGWNENTYKSHENGARGLKLNAARKYAKAFGTSTSYLLTGEIENRISSTRIFLIPVYNDAVANVWVESVEGNGQQLHKSNMKISAVANVDYKAQHQYARKVSDESISRHLHNGEYAIIVDCKHFFGNIPNRALVCVKRTSPNGLTEHTIKVFIDNKLFTDSHELSEQRCFNMGEADDGTIVEIEGVVIAAHRPLI